MMRNNVEFIGGPFDGYSECCDTALDRLPADLVCFVTENIYRMLDGRDHGFPRPATSVALYERDLRCGVCRYQFVGAISLKGVLDEP